MIGGVSGAIVGSMISSWPSAADLYPKVNLNVINFTDLTSSQCPLLPKQQNLSVVLV